MTVFLPVESRPPLPEVLSPQIIAVLVIGERLVAIVETVENTGKGETGQGAFHEGKVVPGKQALHAGDVGVGESVMSLCRQASEIVIRPRKVGFEPQGLQIARHSFPWFALFRERDGKIVMGLHEIRLEPNCLAVTGKRFFRLALVLERVAQVVVGVGIPWVDAHGLPVRVNGLFELALVLEDITQVVVRVRIFRIQTQRRPVTGDRLAGLPAGCIHHAQIVAITRVAPVDGDGPANRLDGEPDPATLISHQAKQIQCLRVVGIGSDDLPANAFRLARTASHVMLQGRVECFGNSGHDEITPQEDTYHHNLQAQDSKLLRTLDLP